MKMRLLLLITCSAASAAADPAWVAQLEASYAKLDGFLATYESHGKGKSLEVVLGLDETSGLAVLHMTATKDGQSVENRQWNTEDDKFHVQDSKGNLIVVSGMREELSSYGDLQHSLSVIPDPSIVPARIQFTPSFWMTKDSIFPAMNFISQDQPWWLELARKSTKQESGEKGVTFLTPDIGSLTLSAETGLPVRQSIASDDGEMRVLELKELKLNPGREAIAGISAGWKKTGATEAPAGLMTRDLRWKIFQNVIDSVTDGKADLASLEKNIGSHRESLRHFADACITESPGTMAATADWESLLMPIKENLKKAWQAEAGNDSEEAFEAYLANPEIRDKARETMVTSMLQVGGGRKRMAEEIFGKTAFDAKGEAGEAARHLIEEAIARAYLEAMIDRKMKRYWGERSGLD